MDTEYITTHLKKFCKLMYGGDVFARFNEKRNVFIFGSIVGEDVFKNVTTRSLAIWCAVGTTDLKKKTKC